jgi:uncharacterized protein (TIGR00369 family)
MTKKTFDNKLGVIPVISKKGYCKFKLKVKPEHLNQGEIVHGGVITSLCDVSLAGAINHSLNDNEWCVTAELNVNFLYPAFLGETIFGYGKLIKKGATLAFVEGGVENKEKKQIARASGIWVVKSRKNNLINKKKIKTKALS